MRRLALGVLVVAACGDDGTQPDAASGPPDAEVPGGNVAALSATGAEYVRYRNGRGAWQTPEQDAAGDYLLHVSDDYQYVVVCDDDTGFQAFMAATTFEEDPYPFTFCFKGLTLGPTVQVS